MLGQFIVWKTAPTLLGPPTQAPGLQPETLLRALPTIMAPADLSRLIPLLSLPQRTQTFQFGEWPLLLPQGVALTPAISISELPS